MYFVDFGKNPEAAKESLDTMKQMFKAFPHSMLICCEDKDGGEIVGATVTVVSTNSENIEDCMKINFKTKEMTEVLKMFVGLIKFYDVCKANNVDRFAEDRGLDVSRDYCIEVLKELLTIRRKQCKELNAPLASIWAMSEDIQRAAEAAGWETAFEVSREEVGKELRITITQPPASYKVLIGKPLQ